MGPFLVKQVHFWGEAVVGFLIYADDFHKYTQEKYLKLAAALSECAKPVSFLIVTSMCPILLFGHFH